MKLPWMKLYTRDWLDNKELRRCSPLSRAVLIDLMCLAQEGMPYGYLADKVGPLTAQYMASRCVVTASQFTKAIAELQKHGRVAKEANKILIPRMVEDEALRLTRADAGGKGGNPKLVNPEVNLDDKLPSRARVPADSDCGSDSESSSSLPRYAEFPKTDAAVRRRCPTADLKIVTRIIKAAVQAYISVDKPKCPQPMDEDIAAAVDKASAGSPKQTSPGLFLTTVPNVIKSWAELGRQSYNGAENPHEIDYPEL